MNLTKQINKVYDIGYSIPAIKYRVQEDNQSCITVANSQKALLRIKHISIKYHHFRSIIQRGESVITYIDTKLQLADIITKPVEDSQFFNLQYLLIGW